MEEGTLQIEHNGHAYHGRWQLENDVVSVWVGDIGPISTQRGISPAETVARWLMQEFLNGQAAS